MHNGEVQGAVKVLRGIINLSGKESRANQVEGMAGQRHGGVSEPGPLEKRQAASGTLGYTTCGG